MPNRRQFLRQTALTAGGAALASPLLAASHPPEPLKIHLFSKHLQFLDLEQAAQAAARMGFAGLDWTIRPGGHVAPERHATDLPRAITAARRVGLSPALMTTAVLDLEQSGTRELLRTAATQGITHYRLGYYRFPEEGTIPTALSAINERVKILASFNEEVGLQGGYQNHSGRRVGAAIWDIHHLLAGSDPGTMGCQYDIRHATVEGGESWPVGLRLIAPRINSIVLKDFRWEKVQGKWRAVNVPIGEGMVDFAAYFRWLQDRKINVPVSLHCEYDLGGAEHGDRKIRIPPAAVFAAIERDLRKVRELWQDV